MQYRDTTPKLQTAIREDKSANAASVPLFSGLGLYLFINSATELESQIAEVQKQNLPGVALFSAANLSVYSHENKNGIFREKAVPVHRDPEYAIKVYIDDLCERILKNGRYLGLEEEVLQSYVEQIQGKRRIGRSCVRQVPKTGTIDQYQAGVCKRTTQVLQN